MSLNTEIGTAITDTLAEAVADYEDFHRTPELSMQEIETSRRIADELEGLGLVPQAFGGTGVVAVIENGEGPVVAYRADTDGLPIAEDTGLPYSSTAEGVLPDGTTTPVMHGCGHDTHITVGLHLARALTAHRDAWSGTVVLLFQPGEEIAAGAKAMLEDGLWETVPKPEVVYGQHVWPGRAGDIYVSSGTAMAMSDSLRVTIRGRQAHGSQPENAIDPIVLGAFMITRLQTVVSREISGRDAAVVTVGTFHGGLKENIIPETAEFTLNIRTFDEDVRATVLDRVRRIIAAEAQASGAPEPVVEEMHSFPRCFNDPDATAAFVSATEDELGAAHVHVVPAVTGSEDVGAFADAIGVPLVYWFFGGYSAEAFEGEEPPAGNHSPHFAPDDVPTTLRTGLRAALTAVFSRVGK